MIIFFGKYDKYYVTWIYL